MDTRWWIGSIAIAGCAIVATTGWHLFDRHDPLSPSAHALAVLVLVGGAGAGLVYGAYWHATGNVGERYPRIVAWMFAGGVLFAVVSIASLYIGSRSVRAIELLEVIQLSGSVGLLAGLTIGTIQVRSIQNAEAAARAEARAEVLEAERERMKRLNDLLRHYVLNGVNVIVGYVTQLRSGVPESRESELDAIEESARTIGTLIRHVRSLPTIAREETPTQRVDPEREIGVALATVESRSDVDIERPDAFPAVRANETLGEAFYLLADALAATLEDGGELRVEHDATPGHLVVSILATPASLPESVAESLFEPVDSGVGLEFFLAGALLEDYGEVRLVENDADRLRFEVELDRE